MSGAPEITFAVLGPLEVRQADRLIRLSGKQRAVLGVLLLDVNTIHSRDRLVDALWDDPPSSAIANIHTYVSGLRRVLSDASAGQALRLETRGKGYSLAVDRDRLDLLLFTDAVERGHQAAVQGALSDADRELASAVALWRGLPLSDVPLSGRITPRLTQIEERFEEAWGDWINVRLSLGRHAELVSKLRQAAEAQPLREPVWEQLIIALYGARRRGEALETYQLARTTLVNEMGIEPGPELQRLHSAILNDDPSVARPLLDHRNPAAAALTQSSASSSQIGRPPASPSIKGKETTDHGRRGDSASVQGWVRPAEVPHDVGGFAGRTKELGVLSGSLGADKAEPGQTNVWVISGAAGVGKTALAVHWAHIVADAFPDGQLYVDLHGFNPQRTPVEPAGALAQTLVSLGVDPGRIPEGLEAREKLYRSVTRGRQILLLLDDARTAEQVRPLLPGHRGAVVLVTSRFRLNDLIARDHAGSLPLAVLSPSESCELLSDALGAARLAAEPTTAQELGRLCGYLPLALRLAAANITANPAGTITWMVDELSRGDRLTQLSVDGERESAVGAALRLSYDSLPRDQQRTFRLLSLLPASTFTSRTVIAMLDCNADLAARNLTALAAAHLIEHQGADRYRFHDLVRLYAEDRAEKEETPQSRQRALCAAFAYYLRGADAAGATISSSTFPLPCELPAQAVRATSDLGNTALALEWLQAELDNIVSLVAYSLTNELVAFGWYIMDALRPFLSIGIYREEWLELGKQGLDAAELADNRLAQATMLLNLGVAELVSGKHTLAVQHLELALEVSGRCGWPAGVTEAEAHLHGIRQRLSQFDEAADHASSALNSGTELDRPNAQAAANIVLGSAHWRFGDVTQALRCQERAYFLYGKTGSMFGQAICLTELAAIRHELGNLGDAESAYREALVICERIGARGRQVQALVGLSRLYNEKEAYDQALHNAELAATLVSLARDRRVRADVLDALAQAYLAVDRREEGYEYQQRALETAQRVGVPWDIAYILISMTKRRTPGSNQEELRSLGERAFAITHEHRFCFLKGKASEALAIIETPGEAAPLLEIAITAYRRANHRPGVERVQRLLAAVSDGMRDRGD